jgi:predicted ATPase/DNA-binding CsgD family transcriptional regulator
MADPGPARMAPSRHSSQLDSFVGRVNELAELERLFDSSRLVTITGPGGSGKTRLALELVERVRPRLASGAAFIDLAPLRDPALIPSVIAAAIVLDMQPGLELLDRIVSRLDESYSLLVLDNCEQLLPDGAGIVSTLLARSLDLHVLGTSRTPFNLRGEREFPLDPLAVPDTSDQTSVELLERNDAVALFVDRARAINPHLELTSENASAIAGICRRLDGLPLALELAAARTRVLSVKALLNRLDRALPVLTSGPLDAPARQRSLRDTVMWSYDLLSPIERRVFARLSVFVGGARLDTARSVLLNEREAAATELLDILDRLVNQALVRVRSDPDGESRFTMLETIRDLAAERLEDDGETAQTRQRHAETFLALAEEAALDQMPVDTPAWYVRFEREHDNLRSAMAWFIEGRDEAELRLVGLLWRFWLSHDHQAEARTWIEGALVHHHGGETVEVAGAFRAAAMLAFFDGRPLDGVAHAERSLTLSVRLGDRPGVAVSLFNIGRIAAAAGRSDRARFAYAGAIRLADELDKPAIKAAAVANLAVEEMHGGRYVEAAELLRESLAIARSYGSFDWIAFAADNLAGALVAIGDYEGALRSVRECIAAARALGPLNGRTGHILRILAAVAAGIGEARVGARLLPTSDRLFRRPSPEPYSSGSAPEPFSGNLRASTERALRTQLGLAFDAAYESGRSLSVDEAIEEGLSLVVREQRRKGPGEHDGTSSGRSRHDLTPREVEVLGLVAAGRSDGEIAAALFISKKTASVHVANIKGKLGVASRVEIALSAQQPGLTVRTGPR